MWKALTLVTVAFLLLGCSSTTSLSDSQCQPPVSPDSRLLESPEEFEVLQATSDKDSIGPIAQNNLVCSSIRTRYIQLQDWAKREMNRESISTE